MLIIAFDTATPAVTVALHAAAGREFVVATDARRREVYWAKYGADGQRLCGPAVSLPAELAAELPAGSQVAGQGPTLYQDLAASFQVIGPAFPDAADLAELVADRIASGLPPDPAEPLYLRRPDAREPGRPKRVTPA